MTTSPFVPPSAPPPAPPAAGGKLAVTAPIAAPIPPQRSVWAIVLPIALIVGLLGFIVAMYASGMRTMGYGGMFGGLMMFGVIGMMLRGRGASQRMSWSELNQYHRGYFSEQDDTRDLVDASRRQQWDRQMHFHPDPKRLISVAASSRMWERSTVGQDTHKEFAVVRVGTGKVAVAMTLEPQKVPEAKFMEPATGHALRRFLIEQAHISDMPKTIWLQRFPGVSFVGALDGVRAVTRAMLCQLAAFHSPADVQIFVVTDEPQEWEWLKWMPHAQHAAVRDGCGERRLIFASPDELEQFFDEAEAAPRGRWNAPSSGMAQPAQARPLRIIVDDHCGQPGDWGGLTGATGYDGTCFIRLAPQVPLSAAAGLGGEAPLPWVGFDPASTYRLSEDGALRKKIPAGSMAGVGEAPHTGDELDDAFYAQADQLSADEAEAFARAMARWRARDFQSMARAAEEQRPTLLQTLGVVDPVTADWSRLWAPRRVQGPAWLRFPIGTDDARQVVHLDLKEGSQGGMGMHSLFVGTTGAGKSEGIITEVCALCATHSPEVLNIVFMDFKMKSAAGALEKFPHTLAAVSNLRSETHLLGRFYEALHGELDRRGEIVASYEDCQDLTDYNRLRLSDPSLPAVPALYIIIDEYNEALGDPNFGQQFKELFLRICRQGRSMHMFLQLVGQNVDSQKLRDIEKLLGFRIIGRTGTEEESMVAMKTKVAAHIAPEGEEGTAYLKVAQGNPSRFRYFYCSGDFIPAAAGETEVAEPIRAGTWFEPRPFTAEVADDVDGLLAAPPEIEAAAAAAVPAVAAQPIGRLHQVLAESWTRTGIRVPRALWLPPLPRLLADGSGWDRPLPTVEEMVARYRGKPWDVDYGDNPGLRFPIALEDDPRQSTQRPYFVDLLNDNVIVVGAPQRGSTTTLMTLVTAGALMYRPERVQFYCIAASGPQMAAVSDLPHVAAAVPLLDTEGVGRVIASVRQIAAERERAFAARGLDIETVRAAKFGPHPAETGIAGGDIVLVIDGWANFSKECPDLVGDVESLMRARNYGIRVVLSATSHIVGLSMAVKNEAPMRVELSLGDPNQSWVERRGPERKLPAKDVPAMPGRGLSHNGNQFMVGLPVVTGPDGAAAGVREIGAIIRERAGVERDVQMQRLPESVGLAEVLKLVEPGTPQDWLPIGLSESTLGPAYLRLGEDPHAVAVGLAKSGRTAFLRTVCQAIMARYSPDEAAILLCDPRRKLAGVVPREYLWFYGFLADSIRGGINNELVPALKRRMPPSDATPEEQLTTRYWSGREIFVIVDDITAWSLMESPYHGLGEYIGQADSLGLHVIATADIQQWTMGAAAPSSALGRMMQSLTPTLIMDGDRTHGVIAHGQRAAHQRPGKGTLATSGGTEGVLVAWTEPPILPNRK